MAKWEIGGAFPGALGDVVAMHGRYYSERWGLDACFEIEVGREVFEFAERFDPSRDLILAARSGTFLDGFVAVDGLGAFQGGARLRWFIVSEAQAGKGLGKALLERALGFVREKGYPSVYLWTYEGLAAARRLYDRCGFELDCVSPGLKWGRELCMQKLSARM